MYEYKSNQPSWVQSGYIVIGTCSICGGAVTVPTAWSGVVPPVPTCASCGAIKNQPYGPVIDMVARKVGTRAIFGPRNYVNTSGGQVDNPNTTLGSNSTFPSDSK